MLELQEKLGHTFNNRSLLEQALTHKSCGPHNNERLEFIGDSILNMVAALLLFERFPELSEGSLSRTRAALVQENALTIIGTRLGVADHLRVDNLDGKSKAQPSMIADAVEALFGAVYMDVGLAAAIRVVRRQLIEVINNGEVEYKKDPKTTLQELLQSRSIPLPVYSLVSKGNPAIGQPIHASCEIAELKIRTVGSGTTKKKAEAEAASRAIQLCPR